MTYDIELSVADGVAAGVVSDSDMARDVVLPVQTHGCHVAVIERDGILPPLDDTDAVISFCEGMKVGVRTADCVPVVLYAPDIRAVAAVHAGWKGSLGGIVSETVARLVGRGADPSEIRVAFGPCICGDCYEVSEELADEFRHAGFGQCIVGTRHLDLEAVNRVRLLRAGVMDGNIVGKRYCTCCTPVFPSWRRSHTDRRLVTYIRL